jgi:type VI secretion system protein ImpD
MFNQNMQMRINMNETLNTMAEEMIGNIDEAINRQLNAVLHHQAFQNLESAWRGIHLLTASIEKTQRVKIRFLPLAFRELAKDLTGVAEFDQSSLFKKVFTEELDQAGGEPFGLLLGDYYISNRIDSTNGDSIETLKKLAEICAAAFVPFITSISAVFFELDSLSSFQSTLNIDRLFESEFYHRWHKLRREENSHFIGITMPRMLMRQPYNANGVFLKQKSFKEIITCHDDYLWGNASYLYASVVIKSFEQTGWFMNLRGIAAEKNTQQFLSDNRASFISNPKNLNQKIITECLITDNEEKILSDVGFIALRDHRLAEQAIFYSSQSIKFAKHASNDVEYTQARINTMLHYILCASRFAHYIKVIIRDKVGAFISVEECQSFMQRWLNQYCSSAKEQSVEAIMKKPLVNANVTVKEMGGTAGKYFCAMSISPHSQLDDIHSELRLVTNVRLT